MKLLLAQNHIGQYLRTSQVKISQYYLKNALKMTL